MCITFAIVAPFRSACGFCLPLCAAFLSRLHFFLLMLATALLVAKQLYIMQSKHNTHTNRCKLVDLVSVVIHCVAVCVLVGGAAGIVLLI